MDRITKAVELIRQDQLHRSGRSHRPVAMAPDERPEVRRVVIPPDRLRQSRIMLGSERDECSQAYKVLRTRVWHQLRANGWHSLGVTSANSGEGKTLTAINLAINLAMMEIGRTVVLVDLDMRRFSVAGHFGIRPQYGISDYLMGEVPLQDILVDIGIPRFALIPGTTSLLNASEVLSSPRVNQFQEELRSLIPPRLVIFDLPPLLVTDDVLVMAPHINAFLLVVEEGRTRSKDLSKVVELLKGVNLVGAVLNKSEESNEHYYRN